MFVALSPNFELHLLFGILLIVRTHNKIWAFLPITCCMTIGLEVRLILLNQEYVRKSYFFITWAWLCDLVNDSLIYLTGAQSGLWDLWFNSYSIFEENIFVIFHFLRNNSPLVYWTMGNVIFEHWQFWNCESNIFHGAFLGFIWKFVSDLKLSYQCIYMS